MQDYYKGCIAGVAATLTSHPFDTIKTNIQEKKPISLNPKFLYRGILSPILGIGFENAVVFGTQSLVSSILKKNDITGYKNIFISGACSGLAASFVVTPFERIKILLQTNNKVKLSNINPKFLYKGTSATLTRETPGFAIYFSSFEYMKNNFTSDKNLPFWKSLIFGGLSGALSWVFIYPQDRIKTAMQSSINSNNTFVSTMKHIVKTEGLTSLYRGFSLALLRAVPLHATALSVMQLLKDEQLDIIL